MVREIYLVLGGFTVNTLGQKCRHREVFRTMPHYAHGILMSFAKNLQP